MLNQMKLTLDRRSNTELYIQVANQVRKLIVNREIYPNRPLPTYQQLADKLSCKTEVIEKAYQRLSEENLIHKGKTDDYWVAFYEAPKTVLTNFNSIYQSIENAGFKASFKTTHKEILKCDSVKDYPIQDPTKKLLHLQRTYFADGNPVGFINIYFPIERFKDIDKVDFENEIVLDILQKHYSVETSLTSRRFKAEIGSDVVCSALGIENASSVFMAYFYGYDKDSNLIVFSKTAIVEHMQVEWQIEAKDLDHFY